MADPIHDMPPGLQKLREVMARLRDPENGCPWDLEQDFRSIAPYTIEEAYEVADTIERDAMEELPGELGDLLLQVIYHARMAEEGGHFDLDDVVHTVTQKMIDRHPHVFGSETRDKSAAEQSADWEAAKARERGAATGTLDGVARGLPALLRAVKLQKRAARVGFDWDNTEAVIAKIAEEAGELNEARRTMSPEAVADEFGDLLFAVSNLARHLGVDPEAALRGTNEKFIRRFVFIEAALAERGKRPAESDLTEMDTLWEAAKARERDGKAANAS
ncbi:ATP diphosphatase [Palleronia aestuarii]|uniref:Nucleoside triphosphate pyrophosphohydrolase n=1 Tax=Palleronia aestuarii TaxID=568105 RepID=A0A2W7NAT4_9RHOB|nr:nucleoside triphosphate pyrophosphohydrolase [Palleronia aestuarii]PZX17515.1 ATP diphosphatase [Palleronia aestuarii]